MAPLDIAIEVAEEVGLPVMAHLDHPPPSRLEVLSRLRRGDIITHCFRPFPNAPVAADGRIREEVMEARRRGVVFDIGHGGGSFGFRTAERMLEAGFLPDVISSDVHALSVNGPAFDQLVTMSKFLALGVELGPVIRASTAAPAAALGRDDLGRLTRRRGRRRGDPADRRRRFRVPRCAGRDPARAAAARLARPRRRRPAVVPAGSRVGRKAKHSAITTELEAPRARGIRFAFPPCAAALRWRHVARW